MILPGEVYMADFPSVGPIGTLDEFSLRDVIKANGYAIASDCEPL